MPYLNDQQARLLEKGIIDLLGDVDEEMFGYIRECMLELALRDNPPIRINITSRGGGVNSGLLIYDLLRLYPGETTGVVIAFASSIAAVMLQACKKRESTQNSLILIHHIRRNEVSLDKFDDPAEIKKIKKSLRESQEKIYLIFDKKTKMSRAAIIALCKEERELSAQEALKFGFIDEII